MKLLYFLALFAVPSLCDEWNTFVRNVESKLDYGGLCHMKNKYRFFEKQSPVSTMRKYFTDQLVDHFDPNNKKTWKQTYFVHEPLGEGRSDTPIVIVGGEGPTGDTYGLWSELVDSNEYTGFTVAHRYYQPGVGDNPTDTFDPKKDGNLLSAAQALADLALFIQKVVMGQYGFKKLPIVFGCSYPGSLTIWFREKYPHLSVGNLALSGPIVAQDDYHQYLEVGEKAVKDNFPTCFSKLFPAKKALSSAAANQGTEFAKQMHVCTDTGFTDWPKIFTIGWVRLSLTLAAGVGQNGALSMGREICDNLEESPYAMLRDVLGLGNYGCRDPNDVLQEAFTAQDSEQGDPDWWWQKCTEFGWFKTHSNDSLFQFFPLEDYYKVCKEDFFVPEDKILAGIKATNENYHGTNITSLTNLLIMNGGDDPWHAASMPALSGDDYTKVVSKIIPKAHHCTFLNYGFTAEAKSYAKAAVKTWLKQ